MITTSLLSLFATLMACRSAMATPAASANFRAFEPRRLQEKASCFRNDAAGNITTTCTEASGIESSCTANTDGSCSYTAVDMNAFKQQLPSVLQSIPANFTNGEAFLTVFGFMIIHYVMGQCDCANSSPDCSMANYK